jgi:hypothetical protein
VASSSGLLRGPARFRHDLLKRCCRDGSAGVFASLRRPDMPGARRTHRFRPGKRKCCNSRRALSSVLPQYASATRREPRTWRPRGVCLKASQIDRDRRLRWSREDDVEDTTGLLFPGERRKQLLDRIRRRGMTTLGAVRLVL